jgi:hypothetical protein
MIEQVLQAIREANETINIREWHGREKKRKKVN